MKAFESRVDRAWFQRFEIGIRWAVFQSSLAFNFNLRQYIQGIKWEGGLTVAVPKRFLDRNKNTKFKELFVDHCSFGKGKVIEDMDGTAFARMMKNTNVMDGVKLSSTEVGRCRLTPD